MSQAIQKPKTVWLLTTGDGDDGNVWQVHGIYSSQEVASDAHKRAIQMPHMRHAELEQWTLNKDHF